MRQRKLLRSHLAYLTISIAVGIDPLVNSNGTDPLLLLLRPDLTSEKQKDSEDGEKNANTGRNHLRFRASGKH